MTLARRPFCNKFYKMSSSVIPVWHFCEICVPHTTSACHTLSPLSPLSCLSFLHSPLPLVYYFNYAGDKATTATPTHCHLHKVCASCLRFCSCSQKSNKTKSRDGPSFPSLCHCPGLSQEAASSGVSSRLPLPACRSVIVVHFCYLSYNYANASSPSKLAPKCAAIFSLCIFLGAPFGVNKGKQHN